MQIRIISDVISQLGESPVWCDMTQQLYYVDILQNRLIRYIPDQDVSLIDPLPFLASAVILTTQKWVVILISDKGLFYFDILTKTFSKLADYPDKIDYTRPNEGAVSPDGDIIFGTMPYKLATNETKGCWYQFDSKCNLISRIGAPVIIPNTLCWYQNLLFFADSQKRTMYVSDNNMQTFESFFIDQEGISPDGSTITNDGELWNAKWGASKLACYSIKKDHKREITLPTLNPTSCCFGGEDLSTLYVTSSTLDIDNPDQNQGCLLAISDVGRGQKPNRFNKEL